MNVCMHVRMYVRMDACMYACIAAYHIYYTSPLMAKNSWTKLPMPFLTVQLII